MSKFKQLTLEQKESIIQLRQNGLRIYEIAKKLNRNRNTIAYFIKNGCKLSHGNSPHSQEYIIKYLKSKGYTFISDKNDVRGIIQYYCPKKHIIFKKFSDFHRGVRCKQCFLESRRTSTEIISNTIKSYGYSILSLEYVNIESPINLICPNGHRITMRWSSFKKGHRCRHCSNESKRIPLEKIETIAKQRGFNIIKHVFKKNSGSHILCKCPNGHEICINSSHFITEGTGCKYCANQDEREFKKRFQRRGDRIHGIKAWKGSVFKKDNYICQKCHISGNGNIVAHHLNGYHWDIENRLNINNGVTLCQQCHIEFHNIYGNKNNTIKQYNEWAGTQLALI